MFISTATAIRHPSTNTSDKSNERDSNYSTRAGSNVRFLSTSTEQSSRTRSLESRIQESEKNESRPVTMQTVSSAKLNTTNTASTHATSPSASVSPASVSEISNTSKSVSTASSHEATSTDNQDIGMDGISTTAIYKSNGRDSNNSGTQSAATRLFSAPPEGSTKPASLDSQISQGSSIASNLPTVETVTQHEPITNITTSTKLTTASDNELTTLNKSAFVSTSAASSNIEGSIDPGNNHFSSTGTRNANTHHNNNDATLSRATSVAISTEESSRIRRGDSQIYENSSTTVPSTSTAKVETAETTNSATGLGNTGATIMSKTAVPTLKNTSESVFTSTSTVTSKHVVNTDTITKHASTTATDQSNNEGSENVAIGGFVTRSTKTSTTGIARIALNDTSEISSSSTEKTVTVSTNAHESEIKNSDMTTPPSRVTLTSDSASANSSRAGLIHTSILREASITTGLNHPSTEAAYESNRHKNMSRTPKNSVIRTTKASNGESTETPPGVSHISEITSKVSDYSTEKTATRITTTHEQNASTSTTSATSTSAAFVTKYDSNTTKAVTNTSKLPTSNDGFSRATGKHHPSTNKSSTNEHDSNYGSREGATVKFFSTSTEKTTRATTIDSGTPESEMNVSSSETTEAKPVETVKTTHKAHTNATTPLTSTTAAPVSEMSTTSRTVVAASSHPATSTENIATRIDRISTTATVKSKLNDSNNGDMQSSTTRSFSKSTEASTKLASLDSHTSEGIVSNSPTAETVTQQRTNITQEHITTSTNLISASETEQTNNNRSVLVSTSATSRNAENSIASGSDHSATTATRNVNVNHDNNATTSSLATISVTRSTEESTRMTSVDPQISEDSSTASRTSTGKAETAEITTIATGLEDTEPTPSTTASRTSVTTLRNTSESDFTNSSAATTSTYVVSTDTVKKQSSTTITVQSNNEASRDGRIEGTVTHHSEISTTEIERIPSRHFKIYNNRTEISSSSTEKTVSAPTKAHQSGQENSGMRTSTAIVTSASDTAPVNSSQTVLIQTSTYTPYEASIVTGLGHPSTAAADESNAHQNNNATINGSVRETTKSSNKTSTAIPPGDSHISETTSKVSNYSEVKTTTASTMKATHNASTNSPSSTSTSAASITQHDNGTTIVVTSNPKALTSIERISTAGDIVHPPTGPADKTSKQHSGESSTVHFLNTSVEEGSRVTSVHSRIWNSNNTASTSATRETVSEQRNNTTRHRTTETLSPSSITASSAAELANSSTGAVIINSTEAVPTDPVTIATGTYNTSSTTIRKANDHNVDNLTTEVTSTLSVKFSTEESTRSSFKVSTHAERSSITSSTVVTKNTFQKNTTDEVLRKKVNTSASSAENTTAASVPTHEDGATSLTESVSQKKTSTDSTSTTSGREQPTIDVLAITPAKPRSFPGGNSSSKASITNGAGESHSSPTEDSHDVGRATDIANTTLAIKSSAPETTNKSMDSQPTATTLISSPTSTDASSLTEITNDHSSTVRSSTETRSSTDAASKITRTEHTSSEILGITKAQGSNNASVDSFETPSITSESDESFSTTDSNPTESSSKVVNMSASKPTATNTSVYVRGLENNDTTTIATTVRMTTASSTEKTSQSATAANIENITEHATTNSGISYTQPCRNLSSGDSILADATTKMNSFNVGSNISADGSVISSHTTYPTNAVAKQSTANPNISATDLFTSISDTTQSDSSIVQSWATDTNSSDAISYSTAQDTPRSEPSIVPQDSVTTLADNSSIEPSSTGSFSSVKTGNCSGKSEKTATQLPKASTIPNPTSMVTISSLEHNSTSPSTSPQVVSSSSFAPSSDSINLNSSVGITSDAIRQNQNISTAANNSLFLPSTSAASSVSLQMRNFTQTGNSSSTAPCISQKANNSRATSEKSSHTRALTTHAVVNRAGTPSQPSMENSSTAVYVSVKPDNTSSVATMNLSTGVSTGATSPTESSNVIKGENSSAEYGVSSRSNISSTPCNSTHSEKRSTVAPTSHLAVENSSDAREAVARHDVVSAKLSVTSPGEHSTATPTISPTGHSETAAAAATVQDYIFSAVHNVSTGAKSSNVASDNSSANELMTKLPCRNTTSASSISPMDSSSSSEANIAEVDRKSTIRLNTFPSVDTSGYASGSTPKSQQSDLNTADAHNNSTHKLNVTGVESSPVQYRNDSGVTRQLYATTENSSDTNRSSGKYNSVTKPTPGCKNSTSAPSIPREENSTSNLATNAEANTQSRALSTTSTGKRSSSYFNIWTTASGPAQISNGSNVALRDATVEEMFIDSTRTAEKENAPTTESVTPPPCKNVTIARTDSPVDYNSNVSNSFVRAESNSSDVTYSYPIDRNQSSTREVSSSTSAPKLFLPHFFTTVSSSAQANGSHVATHNTSSAKKFNYTHTTARENNSNSTNGISSTLSSFITTSDSTETDRTSSNESSPAKNKKKPCPTNSSLVIKNSTTTLDSFAAVNSSKVAADATSTNSSSVTPKSSLTPDTNSYPASTESADLSKSNGLVNEARSSNSTAKDPSPFQSTTSGPRHREPCEKTKSVSPRRSVRSKRGSRRLLPLGRLRT
ncbi:serine-rich adhesin for platelets-like [Rhipicephalus sanguineus]|uniref:serine-rich adhesin for platelets-like n=1 Tax=Rhipicephalus sanguineus TaxID=34632 RepID=UPI0018938E08|nr:serine-rich adhesin for platelets-like [Rhipicephalus sanguineus]